MQIGARSTPLDGRTGRMQGIFHTSFLLLHFALDRGADTYYGNTTGELGQTLLQFSQKIASGFVESAINQIVSKRMVKRQQMGWCQRGAHLLPRDPPESPALGTEPREIGRYIVDPRKLRDHIHDLRDSTSRAAGPGCRAMLLFYSNKRTNLNRHCKVPQKPHYPYGSGFP